jgi:hypothetical protein
MNRFIGLGLSVIVTLSLSPKVNAQSDDWVEYPGNWPENAWDYIINHKGRERLGTYRGPLDNHHFWSTASSWGYQSYYDQGSNRKVVTFSHEPYNQYQNNAPGVGVSYDSICDSYYGWNSTYVESQKACYSQF